MVFAGTHRHAFFQIELHVMTGVRLMQEEQGHGVHVKIAQLRPEARLAPVGLRQVDGQVRFLRPGLEWTRRQHHAAGAAIGGHRAHNDVGHFGRNRQQVTLAQIGAHLCERLRHDRQQVVLRRVIVLHERTQFFDALGRIDLAGESAQLVLDRCQVVVAAPQQVLDWHVHQLFAIENGLDAVLAHGKVPV